MANGFTKGLISLGLCLDKPLHQTFQVGFLWGVVKGDIVEEHGIRNPEGLNDLEKDGEVEDFRFYRKNWDDSSTPDCK